MIKEIEPKKIWEEKEKDFVGQWYSKGFEYLVEKHIEERKRSLSGDENSGAGLKNKSQENK